MGLIERLAGKEVRMAAALACEAFELRKGVRSLE